VDFFGERVQVEVAEYAVRWRGDAGARARDGVCGAGCLPGLKKKQIPFGE
jgi:hypothetical protein